MIIRNRHILPNVTIRKGSVIANVFQQSDVIGINLSNYVLDNFNLDSPFGKQIEYLIQYILKETNLHILLIPHVIWNSQDDRITSNNVIDSFLPSNRIVLDISNLNYCQIRYVISNCRFFIGARTHAVISAYSPCVPTLALGYSIKSKGIAKDLGLSNKLVVDTKRIATGKELIESFDYLQTNEEKIRLHMVAIMPEYKKKPFGVQSDIDKLVNM